MSQTLLLPLRAHDAPKNNQGDLGRQVHQIYLERGQFRNLTAESLRREAELERQNGTTTRDVDSSSSDEEEPEDAQEALARARQEVIGKIQYAANEVYIAADFMALTLSKYRENAAMAMSGPLKANDSKGTIESSPMQAARPSAADEARDKSISTRWRSESYKSSVYRLRGAATRLGTDAEKEARFWDQVAKIKSDGWAVSRLPNNSKAIGVHFGCAESAPAFRNRGFALLQQKQNGDITLDGPASKLASSSLAIELFRKGKLYGRTVSVRNEPLTEDSNLEIMQMRDGLLAEELFHELGREGKLLANQGVQITSDSIIIPISNEDLIRIELSPVELDSSHHFQPGNAVARSIHVYLQLLLSIAHKQNLDRRSQQPPPVSLKPRPTPEYALIRPILSHLKHQSALAEIRNYISGAFAAFSVAGIDTALDREELEDEAADATLAVKSLTEKVLQPTENFITLKMPSNRQLELIVKTYLGAPTYGTEYTVKPLEYKHGSFTAPRTSSGNDLQRALRHVMLLELVTFAAEVLAREESKDLWTVEDVHCGELMQSSGGLSKRLCVKVWDDKIGLRLLYRTQSQTGDRQLVTISYIWWKSGIMTKVSNQKQEDLPLRSFVDVVKELAALES